MKPRIKRCRVAPLHTDCFLRWMCSGARVVGYGSTPRAAWVDWEINRSEVRS